MELKFKLPFSLLDTAIRLEYEIPKGYELETVTLTRGGRFSGPTARFVRKVKK